MKERVLIRGLGVSPGVVIGRVMTFRRGAAMVPRHRLLPGQDTREIIRLHEGLQRAQKELAQLSADAITQSDEHKALLQVYGLMLGDALFQREMEFIIRHEQVNAEWAVTKALARLRGTLDHLAMTHLHERQTDLDGLLERLLVHLSAGVGGGSRLIPDAQVAGALVVTKDIDAMEATMLLQRQVAALVVEAGSPTSHAAIVTRAQGVPMIVGAKGCVDACADGDEAVVDGFSGQMICHPTPDDQHVAQAKAWRAQQVAIRCKPRLETATTRDGLAVAITAAVNTLIDAKCAATQGADGLGLVRTELLLGPRGAELSADQQCLRYVALCNTFSKDVPTTIRTFDFAVDKDTDWAVGTALGLRGLRQALANAQQFKEQLRGILLAAGQCHLRLLLPMVTMLDEVATAKTLLSEVESELQRAGQQYTRPHLGVMLEVPSAVFSARSILAAVDFAVVGSNDLWQYFFAADRNNPEVKYLYQPLHPGALRFLESVQTNNVEHKPVMMCGETASIPEALPLLLGLGYRQFVLSTHAVPTIKHMVQALRLEECKHLVAEVLHETSERNVVLASQAFLRIHAPWTEDLWEYDICKSG